MLPEFDFHVTQLRYIKAAVNDIPTYKPENSLGEGPESDVATVEVT